MLDTLLGGDRWTTRRSLVGALAVLTFALTACGSTQATISTDQETVASEYSDQLKSHLSRSDLPPGQQTCVADAVLDAWPAKELEEAKEFGVYTSYFHGADKLVFKEHVLKFDGASELYDIFTGCDVDVRARALAQAAQFHNGGDRSCVRSAATPEGIREHWMNHFLGLETSKSAFQLIVESYCTRTYDEFLDSDGNFAPVPDDSLLPDGSGNENSGDSFCSEQHDLIWEMWREGQLTQEDFELQLQEIEDACVGF